MSDVVDFYTFPVSRGRMVHWMLEEVGASYRPHLLDLARGEQRRPEYLAINPMGKVPAIVHRGSVVTEVGAICTYLAEAFPAAGLAPAPGDPQRGAYLRWMFFSAATLEPAFIDRVTQRPAPTVRPGALPYGCPELLVETLLRALRSSPYLLGDAFSAADVYVGSQLVFGMSVQGLPQLPEFQAYVARLVARPANRRFEQQATEWAAQLQARA
jgi:glutathione S-transferase